MYWEPLLMITLQPYRFRDLPPFTIKFFFARTVTFFCKFSFKVRVCMCVYGLWLIQTELVWERERERDRDRDRDQNGSLYIVSSLHTATFVGT